MSTNPPPYDVYVKHDGFIDGPHPRIGKIEFFAYLRGTMSSPFAYAMRLVDYETLTMGCNADEAREECDRWVEQKKREFCSAIDTYHLYTPEGWRTYDLAMALGCERGVVVNTEKARQVAARVRTETLVP